MLIRRNNCTAPNFEQNVTDHIPEEYREAAQLFVETVQGFPDDFRRCVIKKSRHAMLSGVESCVQNVTESLSDFQFPELDLPEGPKTDEEKKEALVLHS